MGWAHEHFKHSLNSTIRPVTIDFKSTILKGNYMINVAIFNAAWFTCYLSVISLITYAIWE